jgi:hypothetical protein
VKLNERDRTAFVGFLREKLGTTNVRLAEPHEKLEPALRELLYLVLSTPEYQLG